MQSLKRISALCVLALGTSLHGQDIQIQASLDGTNIHLVWNSQPGSAYQIEIKPLSQLTTSGNWLPSGSSITASGTETSASRPVNRAVQGQVYRVRIEGAPFAQSASVEKTNAAAVLQTATVLPQGKSPATNSVESVSAELGH